MKKIYLAFTLIATTFVLTGCVKFTADLEVNKNSTVSGTMILAMSDSLAGLTGTGNSLSQGELIDAKTKGVIVESYKEGGFTGNKYTLNQVPFSEFKTAENDGSLNFKKEGNLIKVSGIMDLSDSSNETDQATQDMTAAMFAGADLHISIKFPYEVIETSGELSSDKRTVTWRPVMGKKTILQATVKVPSFNPVPAILIAVIVITLIVVLIRKRKPKAVEEVTEVL